MLEREEFVESELARAAAAKREAANQRGQAAVVGPSPEHNHGSKSAAHEPAFLGTMRMLTAGGPTRPHLSPCLPPAVSPTSPISNTASSGSSSGPAGMEAGSSGATSEASSAESTPRTATNPTGARMWLLPHLGAPHPSALEMASANGFAMSAHNGPRLPKPWMLSGRQPNGRASSGGAAASDPCWGDLGEDEDEDEEETVPLEAAVEACVVRRMLSQYACTGSACIRCGRPQTPKMGYRSASIFPNICKLFTLLCLQHLFYMLRRMGIHEDPC